MIPTLSLGPVTLSTYGLMMLAGFVAGYACLRHELARKGLDPRIADSTTFGGIVGGLLGARMLHLLEHWEAFTAEPSVRGLAAGGFSWYGGLVGGVLLSATIARLERAPLRAFLDAIVPSILVGYAIGRIGCHLAGDGDYGPPTQLPWATSYQYGLVPTSQLVHPTPLYEAIAALACFQLIWRIRARSRPAGALFCLFLIFSGLSRLVLEFWRLNPPVAFGLTVAQFSAALGVVCGIAIRSRLQRHVDQPQHRTLGSSPDAFATGD
jgi:phosphatidylglycerol:prolipoprotein diacylglycerol transferase